MSAFNIGLDMTRQEREEAIKYLRDSAEHWNEHVRKNRYPPETVEAINKKIRALQAGADALEASLNGLLLTEPQLEEAILTGGPDSGKAAGLIRELITEGRSLYADVDSMRGPLDGPPEVFQRAEDFLK